MAEALPGIFTPNEVKLLENCESFAFLFKQKNPGTLTQSQKVALRFLAYEFNSAMKEKCSENPQNKEMYPNCVESFDYKKNTLFDKLKGCITSRNRSGGQKRQQKTDSPSNGISSSKKGAAGGAAKADAPMEERAAGRNRERLKFSWDEVDEDVKRLIVNLDTFQAEEMERFNKFLIENFGDPYNCKELNNRAPRVFFMEQLLMRMHHRGNMLYDVKMFEDEEGTIQHFLRPGREWKVLENKITEYNAAFRGMQDAYFGRYECSKGYKLKGTTACMDMFRALGFVPAKKAKAHKAPFFRGPEAKDPTKMRDGQGNRIFSARDCLYFLVYEYDTSRVHNNLNHLWKDAKHKLRLCAKPCEESVELLLQAAEVVDSESSSKRAAQAVDSESSLGYSCKRAKFQ